MRDALDYESEILTLKKELNCKDMEILRLKEERDEYMKRAADARLDLLTMGVSGKLMSGSDKYKQLKRNYSRKCEEADHWKQAYIDIARAAFSSNVKED